jgi:hypothetical protein
MKVKSSRSYWTLFTSSANKVAGDYWLAAYAAVSSSVDQRRIIRIRLRARSRYWRVLQVSYLVGYRCRDQRLVPSLSANGHQLCVERCNRRLGGGFERNADLGHAKPGVTLAVYAHMFTSDDRKRHL